MPRDNNTPRHEKAIVEMVASTGVRLQTIAKADLDDVNAHERGDDSGR